MEVFAPTDPGEKWIDLIRQGNISYVSLCEKFRSYIVIGLSVLSQGNKLLIKGAKCTTVVHMLYEVKNQNNYKPHM